MSGSSEPDRPARSGRRPGGSRGSSCRRGRARSASPPWTSMRSRAGPAENSSESWGAVRRHAVIAGDAVSAVPTPAAVPPRPARGSRRGRPCRRPGSGRRSRSVASPSDVPMTAGIPNSRESTAGWEVGAARVGHERRDLREQHDPRRDWSSGRRGCRRRGPRRTRRPSGRPAPIPSTTPGDPAIPLISRSSVRLRPAGTVPGSPS